MFRDPCWSWKYCIHKFSVLKISFITWLAKNESQSYWDRRSSIPEVLLRKVSSSALSLVETAILFTLLFGLLEARLKCVSFLDSVPPPVFFPSVTVILLKKTQLLFLPSKLKDSTIETFTLTVKIQRELHTWLDLNYLYQNNNAIVCLYFGYFYVIKYRKHRNK